MTREQVGDQVTVEAVGRHRLPFRSEQRMPQCGRAGLRFALPEGTKQALNGNRFRKQALTFVELLVAGT